MLFSYAFLPCDKNVTDFTLLRASYPPFPLLRHDVEKNESFGNGTERRIRGILRVPLGLLYRKSVTTPYAGRDLAVPLFIYQ